MKTARVIAVTLVLLGVLLAARFWLDAPPPRGDVTGAGFGFADVTDGAGIAFTHVDGRSGEKQMPEMLGSGAAFFDYDGDGDPDLYLVNGAWLASASAAGERPANRLYENQGDGTFADVTQRARVGDPGYGHGVCAGDYDNDGDLDLYVTNYGANVLLRNGGDGTFAEVTAEAGVAEPRWSTSCAFADYDLDGDLDLYVVNYLELPTATHPWCGLEAQGVRAYCEPNAFPGQPDALYRNNGDGTFADVTREAGVFNPGGKGLGVVWGDYDNDGYPDLYVANDSTENFLYRNLGDGTFEENGFLAGVALSEHGVAENGMGTAFGDWNDDGWLDLVVTNYAEQTNTLYANDRNGYFSNVTAASRTATVSYDFLGWAVEFADFDNDSYLDFFVANGHLQDNLAALGLPGSYPQRNLLFENRRDGTFAEVSAARGAAMRLEEVSRGAAFADYDLDGDVDILVTNSNGPVRLLRNDGRNRNAWISLRLQRAGGAADGIGVCATVRLEGRVLRRDVRSGSGYLSQNDLPLLLGLGARTSAPPVEIRWPGGATEQLDGLPLNRRIVVVEGQRWRLEE